MITRIQGYQSSDGTFHPSLERARQVELEMLLKEVIEKPQPLQGGATFVSSVVGEIIRNGDKIVDILTTTPNSKVRGRKVNGATRKRTPKHISGEKQHDNQNSRIQEQ